MSNDALREFEKELAKAKEEAKKKARDPFDGFFEQGHNFATQESKELPSRKMPFKAGKRIQTEIQPQEEPQEKPKPRKLLAGKGAVSSDASTTEEAPKIESRSTAQELPSFVKEWEPFQKVCRAKEISDPVESFKAMGVEVELQFPSMEQPVFLVPEYTDKDHLRNEIDISNFTKLLQFLESFEGAEIEKVSRLKQGFFFSRRIREKELVVVEKAEWSQEDKKLISWFENARKDGILPTAPFCLGKFGFKKIEDPERFYNQKSLEIEKGSCAFTAELLADLGYLRDLVKMSGNDSKIKKKGFTLRKKKKEQEAQEKG